MVNLDDGSRRQCADGAVLEEPDPHHYLSGERPGHGLAEGDSVQELRAIQPLSFLDKVTLHIAHCGDRPAEPERAEP